MHGRKKQQPNTAHASVWAALTVGAFPIVAITFSWLGVPPLQSFLSGAAASLLILLAEGITRRRWWISEPAIAELFEDPSFARRLLVVLAVVVLLFQTFILSGFLTNRSFDVSVARMILARQCTDPQHMLFVSLCRSAAMPAESVRDSDAVYLAVRNAAESRLLPGGFVTCALTPRTLKTTPTAATIEALVRCDRWMLGNIVRQPTSITFAEQVITATLHVSDDGIYHVDRWTNTDPATPLTSAQRDTLRRQTFRRAMEALSSR
ncbi:MAG: hypothetical protein RL141_821 [Candidatus Parcubacteria bacterium]|jgi:hypothetical protein